MKKQISKLRIKVMPFFYMSWCWPDYAAQHQLHEPRLCAGYRVSSHRYISATTSGFSMSCIGRPSSKLTKRFPPRPWCAKSDAGAVAVSPSSNNLRPPLIGLEALLVCPPESPQNSDWMCAHDHGATACPARCQRRRIPAHRVSAQLP